MSDLCFSYALAAEFLHKDAITHEVENIYYVALDGKSLLTLATAQCRQWHLLIYEMLKRIKSTTETRCLYVVHSGRPEELKGAVQVLEFGGELGDA